MFDFHQKRKFRSVINSPFTQGFVILLVLSVGWSAYVRYEIAMEMTERTEQVKNQVQELEDRKETLGERVEYLSSDRGKEAEIRRQFDIALPGEKVVIIVDKQDDSPEIFPLNNSTTTKEKGSWYQFWR